MVAVLLLVVLLVVLAVLFSPNRGGPQPAAADSTGFIEITAQPWATVKTVVSRDGKVVIPGGTTPMRITASAGQYTVVLAGPDGEEDREQVAVVAGRRSTCNHVFEVVDAKRIVATY